MVNVKEQVQRSCKTTDKIIVLCLLYYSCFRQKYWKLIDSELEGSRIPQISEKLQQSVFQAYCCLQ
jgi:hypothetical protein